MSNQTKNPAESASSTPLPENVAAMTPEQQAALVDTLWKKLHDEKTAAPFSPFVDLNKLSYKQLESLAHEALDKWAQVGQEQATVQQTAKERRIAELQTELARLTGEPEPEPEIDPWPELKVFGGHALKPAEKQHISLALVVAARLAARDVIQLADPQGQAQDGLDDVIFATLEISRAMYALSKHPNDVIGAIDALGGE